MNPIEHIKLRELFCEIPALKAFERKLLNAMREFHYKLGDPVEFVILAPDAALIMREYYFSRVAFSSLAIKVFAHEKYVAKIKFEYSGVTYLSSPQLADWEYVLA